MNPKPKASRGLIWLGDESFFMVEAVGLRAEFPGSPQNKLLSIIVGRWYVPHQLATKRPFPKGRGAACWPQGACWEYNGIMRLHSRDGVGALLEKPHVPDFIPYTKYWCESPQATHRRFTHQSHSRKPMLYLSSPR